MAKVKKLQCRHAMQSVTRSRRWAAYGDHASALHCGRAIAYEDAMDQLAHALSKDYSDSTIPDGLAVSANHGLSNRNLLRPLKAGLRRRAPRSRHPDHPGSAALHHPQLRLSANRAQGHRRCEAELEGRGRRIARPQHMPLHIFTRVSF